MFSLLLVCLFVFCYQDYPKNCGQTFMKCLGGVGVETRISSIRFWDDLLFDPRIIVPYIIIPSFLQTTPVCTICLSAVMLTRTQLSR